ncbi:MAG TPA: HAD family hydrolase, partial [Vicinamibacterales bacterium]
PSVTLAPGAARALQTMRGAGWGLAVLTNGHVAVQRRKVLALGVEALVDCVLYAEEHAAGGKPAPAAFEAAVLRLGVAPARVVMVGNDLDADVRGAERAGLRAIHLEASVPAVPREPAGATVSSLAEVPPLAESLIPRAGADVR